MKLRTQILALLMIFGLTPLVAALVINVPLVFDQLERFYHQEHLQSLRADFRDLDQHLASRHETIKILAKLPEPGALLGQPIDIDHKKIDAARVQYTEWINWMLGNQIDITQILFVDADGNEQFWLTRKPGSTLLIPGTGLPHQTDINFNQAGLTRTEGEVLISAMRFSPELRTSDPQRFMTMQLVSPVVRRIPGAQDNDSPSSLGAVVLTIDVGGLASAYKNTYWVHHSGDYLHYGKPRGAQHTAFTDFPGLEDIFDEGKLALWRGDEQDPVIWVPMFSGEDNKPVWVGRPADPSPLNKFENILKVRVLAIVFALLVLVFLVAGWVAMRVERFGQGLKTDLGQVLQNNEPVQFNWAGSDELVSLGRDLSRLSATHVENNAALQHHADELEESNRYKSEFLANVSHELRTPLNSILLLSKLLHANDNNNLSDEQCHHAQVINHAGKDLLALIDNILDLSRIEAQRTSFEIDQINIPSLIEGLVELIQPVCDEKNISLFSAIADDAPASIRSDKEKIRQILKNFLSNAVKFTNQGAVNIEVCAGPASSHHLLIIRVLDTGIGIPDKKHQLVFEAFKQADGSTSRRYGGTGLGLTISKELALLLGGEITLSNNNPRGAIFTLALPLVFDSESHDDAQISIMDASKTNDTTHIEHSQDAIPGDHKALIVDDDVRNLLALTPQLRKWGIDVLVAASGKEALDALQTETEVDLVLMDIMMPDMDGLETIRHIRQDEGLKELIIIAVSARAGNDDRKKCLQYGADDFIAKPIDTDKLHHSITSLLQERATIKGQS